MMTDSASGKASFIGTRLSVMMFLQFFVWGSWYVSMTGWMGAVGLSDLVSWAYTVGPIAAVTSPFILGIVADRFFATQRILGVMHIVGGIIMAALPAIITQVPADTPKNFFHPFVLLLLAHMLCYMPTLGLTNTLCFRNMTSPEKQFPVVRVFGTIGWIAGGIVVAGGMVVPGLSVTWSPNAETTALQWYVTGSAGILLGIYSLTLPHTPPPGAGKRISIREILGLDSLSLLRRPSYLVFILGSFLICIPLAAYYNQARNFVEHIGFTPPTATMSFGQMAEIVFMILMPAFFARLGVKWMLALGMLAWVVRYGLFSAAADDHVRWMTLAGILLHGICYDFFFVAGFLYVDRAAPNELRGQAQGFLVLVTQGLGLGLGAQVIGWLRAPAEIGWLPGSAAAANWLSTQYGTAGFEWGAFWLIPSVMAGVVLVLFLALFRDSGKA